MIEIIGFYLVLLRYLKRVFGKKQEKYGQKIAFIICSVVMFSCYKWRSVYLKNVLGIIFLVGLLQAYKLTSLKHCIFTLIFVSILTLVNYLTNFGQYYMYDDHNHFYFYR